MTMNQMHPKRARKAVSWLSILTPAAAVLSVINVTISISTSVWLKTSEQIFVDSSNSTMLRSEVPRTKRTVSGLWRLCEYHNLTQVNATITHCFTIDYFAKERYTPEPHDSTMAIPYTVTKAGPLFFAASFLLVCGILCAILGYLWRRKRVATFIAGILFIIAGLVMLIGMVVYLSVLQAEVGQKLRPRNSMDKPVFEYNYGYSFILIVVGFMSTEMTGTCAIFWYIYWHQLDWAEKAGQHHHISTSNRHHHHHRRSQSQQSGHRHHRHPRRQHSHESQNTATADEFLNRDRYQSNAVDGSSYYDRSASSGEDYKDLQWDSRPPHYHRHRSLSHSGAQSMLVSGDSVFSANCYPYGKMYPCKKHGTIPPRYSSSSNHRHHYGPLFTHPCHSYTGDCPQACSQNNKCHKCSHTHLCSNFYDDDLLVDLDVPLPPPPPLPRDITCTTTVSGDDFFLDHPAIANVATNTPNSQRDRSVPRDHRKTTPV